MESATVFQLWHLHNENAKSKTNLNNDKFDDSLTNIVVALRPPVEEAGLVGAADLRLLRVPLVELVALLRRVEETAAREAVESAATGLIRNVGELGRLLRLLRPRPRLWPRFRLRPRPRLGPSPAAGAALLLLLLALLQ